MSRALSGIAAVLAGIGTGLVAGKEDAERKARQAKQDGWQEEQQSRQRKEWGKADQLDADLQAAGTPMTVERPNDVLKDDDGNDMPAVPALRVGAQRYATMADATKAAADANTPEAQNTRMVEAYRKAGQPDKALTMQSTLRQGEAADIALASEKFQRKLGDWMGGGFDGFRDGINAYEAGPFAGRKIDFIVSPDGKTRTVGVVGSDGKVTPTTLTVPNTQEGLIQLGYSLDRKVTPADRLKMLREDAKAELDAQRVAIQERLAGNQERKTEIMMQRLLGGGGGAGGGGRGGSGSAGAPASFDPLGGFDAKKAQAVAFEQAAAAVDAKGRPLSPQEQGKRAQEIYRSMEDAFATENTRRQRATVFRAEARNATTPEEIEAVRQRAAASGYTAEEMAALDKRFAHQTNQTPAAGAGAPAASERAATTPSASAPAQPEADPAYRGGRPAVMDAMFRNSRNAQPAAAAPPEQPRSGRSPQSLGDDFASPMARQALAARVAEAAQGGAPLTKIEALRAQQLRLL